MPYWPQEMMRGSWDNGAGAEVKNLEEARRLINTLAQQNQMQGHLLTAWKRRLKEQNELIFELHREREEQLRLLGSQLLLLEANLRMKQHKMEILLQDRDETIEKQQDSIRSLEKQLSSMMSKTSIQQKKEVLVLSCRKAEENLDDSDSAVVLEECTELQSPVPGAESSPSARNQVKVIRSISDVLENLRKQQKNDFSSDQVEDSSSDDDEEVKVPGIRRSFLRGSLERCPPHNNEEKLNRIYSNHRSVTRPRDVKLKKNHKTKSLDELRHRLKYWQQSNIDTELPE